MLLEPVPTWARAVGAACIRADRWLRELLSNAWPGVRNVRPERFADLWSRCAFSRVAARQQSAWTNACPRRNASRTRAHVGTSSGRRVHSGGSQASGAPVERVARRAERAPGTFRRPVVTLHVLSRRPAAAERMPNARSRRHACRTLLASALDPQSRSRSRRSRAAASTPSPRMSNAARGCAGRCGSHASPHGASARPSSWHVLTCFATTGQRRLLSSYPRLVA